jgi:hypothetical protein
MAMLPLWNGRSQHFCAFSALKDDTPPCPVLLKTRIKVRRNGSPRF